MAELGYHFGIMLVAFRQISFCRHLLSSAYVFKALPFISS